MTDKENLEDKKPTESKEGHGGDQAEDTSDSRFGDNRGSKDSRRPALSKREMMDELSRARFPWEE